MTISGPRLGILGGGQLSRMLVQASSRLGLEPTVFALPGEPATQVCPRIFHGSMKNSKDLRGFFAELDLVIFENEFIPCDLLQQAAGETSVHFSPPLSAMRFVQDKLNQKKTLARLRIPSASYIPKAQHDSEQASENWLREVFQAFPRGAVLKWAQLGYDGKGTFFLNSPKDIPQAALFCTEADLKGVLLYAEERVAFKRELAIVGCLSLNGEFASYPLTISQQRNGICERVHGPAVSFGVPRRLETLARKHAEKLARELHLTGTFALEFFETRDGNLLVNEIAPRVHNTGHFTLDASDTDQFENHLRAVLGLPLGSTRSEPAFAMLNLLGPEELMAKMLNPPLPVPGAQVRGGTDDAASAR
ncbi:MAG: hypothetical protein A2X94_08360 [Bdellovibrionales bacterium GWB1_55_8]|nr:MAG: hypothetical protein A2X94_08360 [Bdellovibrionales bacterium GWB1_55_8]